MKKKIAKRNFIVISIVLAICMLFCFVGFKIPTTNNRFKGFINSLPLGLDFDSGVTAIYNLEIKNDDGIEKATSSTISRIETILSKQFNEYKVERINNDQIRLTIPSQTIQNKFLVNYIQFDSSEELSDEPLVTGKDIKLVKYQLNGSTHCVYIEFNAEGKDKFTSLTTTVVSGSKTLYVFAGESQLTGVSLEEAITTGYAYFTANSKAAAEELVQQIKSGMLGYNMNIVGNVEQVEASLGENAKYFAIALFISLLIVISLISIIRYRQLGYIIILTILCYFVGTIMLISVFEFYQLTLSSLMGILFALIITVWLLYFNVSKCHSEYKSGKKLQAAFKSGYRKCLQVNLDIFAVLAIISTIFSIWGMGAIKSFSVMFLMFILTGAFTILLTNRGLIKMYLFINNTKVKQVGFSREGNKNETQENA